MPELIDAGVSARPICISIWAMPTTKPDRIGLSILNYEKALKLDSSRKDVKHNLRLAQQQTVDNVEALAGAVFYKLVAGSSAFACAAPTSGRFIP
jgi:hypothetical protein